ncbi:hypothetical protein ACFFRR_010178 [Megaselia abdita]
MTETEKFRELLNSPDLGNEDENITQGTEVNQTHNFNSDDFLHANSDNNFNLDQFQNLDTISESIQSTLSSDQAGSSKVYVLPFADQDLNPIFEDGIIDQDLLNTLVAIYPENADFIYNCLIKYNVKCHQIKYLRDFHLQQMIPIDQMGIMAEFQFKLEQWKLSALDSVASINISNSYFGKKTSLVDIISKNKAISKKVNISSLNEKESKLLLNLVKDHYVNNCDNKMTSEEMERIAKEIEKTFPGEGAEIYFKRNLIQKKDGTYKTKSTGRLVSKWSNRSDKETAKKHKLLEESSNIQSEIVVLDVIENEEEQKRIQASLKHSTKKPVEMILKDWAMSRELRLKCLIENRSEKNKEVVFSEWPTYQSPEGNILMADDFTFLYPGVVNNLFLKWDFFAETMLTAFDELITDKDYLKMLRIFDKPNLSKDVKDALILFLLPAVAKPTGRPQLPITDGQDNFVSFQSDVRKLKSLNFKTPRVIIICKTMTGPTAYQEITQIVLYMEGKYFIVDSVLRALEQMFMAYWVFGIEYPSAANNCLYLIMKFFFKMNFIGEKRSPAVGKLLMRLNA